jgi:hypothetical protein
MSWFKIVDIDSKGRIKTLFHGNNKSRLLKLNEWLKAEIKLVRDGTSKTSYMSGWHIAPSLEECINYLKCFTHVENKAIVECEAKKIRPKSHSRHDIYLAELIHIKGIVYNARESKC